jgi:glyoxylase-like metal-dependent hydrolase (beta-lactamase superfamily II)
LARPSINQTVQVKNPRTERTKEDELPKLRIERIIPGMGIRSNVGTMGVAAVTLIRDDVNVLVDTGHFGGRDVLLAAFKERKIEPSEIDVVLLTHFHWDHCLNVDLFKKARILAGEKELEMGYLMDPEEPHTAHFKELLKKMGIETLRDGAKISEHASALSTPGHSPGHVAVAVRGEGSRLTVLSGDAIPNYRAYLRELPDFSYYSASQARASVRRVKKMRPSVIIPGHDSPFNADGYLERDDFTLILRRENEENSMVTLRHVPADKPIVVR